MFYEGQTLNYGLTFIGVHTRVATHAGEKVFLRVGNVLITIIHAWVVLEFMNEGGCLILYNIFPFIEEL